MPRDQISVLAGCAATLRPGFDKFIDEISLLKCVASQRWRAEPTLDQPAPAVRQYDLLRKFGETLPLQASAVRPSPSFVVARRMLRPEPCPEAEGDAITEPWTSSTSEAPAFG